MNASRLSTVLLVNLRLCLLEIFSNKTRSFISSLGIFLGTASLLVNMAFMRAMHDNVVQSMQQMGGVDMITVRSTDPKNDLEKLTFHRSPGLRLSQVDSLVRRIPGVDCVVPLKDLGWMELRGGGRRTWGHVMAIGERYLETYNYSIAVGRTFKVEEYGGGSKVCLLGPQMGERLFGSSDSLLGRTMVVSGVPCEVVGVLAVKDRWDGRGRECHIPFRLYARDVGVPDAVDQVALKVASVDSVASIKRALDAGMLDAHRGVIDFSVEPNQDKIDDLRRASMGIQLVIGAIAFISLCVGAVSIMNTMFGTIGDRIREIGVRKALGAQRIDLFTQFLLEAVLLSFVGGVPGIVLGTAFTLFPAGTFPFAPRLSVLDYVLTVLFIALAGVVSGVFPAFRAATMEPVEALRY